MVWDLKNRNVASVNVTHRYAKAQKKTAASIVNIRLWDKKEGERIIATISHGEQKVTTKAGTADLNDMAQIKLSSGASATLQIDFEGEKRSAHIEVTKASESTIDLSWNQLNQAESPVAAWLDLLPEERHLSIPENDLSKKEATEALSLITKALEAESLENRKKELEAKVIKAAGKEMKYLERQFGKQPADGRSLWISMHGGGGAPARVNDQQWQNQIRLYEPAEGIVVAPRAPSNTWNLWHEGHIDALFARLIDNMVALRGVNPNKIYLMGYSAGGDGVYQLAPRMAFEKVTLRDTITKLPFTKALVTGWTARIAPRSHGWQSTSGTPGPRELSGTRADAPTIAFTGSQSPKAPPKKAKP